MSGVQTTRSHPLHLGQTRLRFGLDGIQETPELAQQRRLEFALAILKGDVDGDEVVDQLRLGFEMPNGVVEKGIG